MTNTYRIMDGYGERLGFVHGSSLLVEEGKTLVYQGSEVVAAVASNLSVILDGTEADK